MGREYRVDRIEVATMRLVMPRRPIVAREVVRGGAKVELSDQRRRHESREHPGRVGELGVESSRPD